MKAREDKPSHGHDELVSSVGSGPVLGVGAGAGLVEDGGHGPGDADAEEHVHGVGASHVTDRVVSALVFNGSGLGGKGV